MFDIDSTLMVTNLAGKRVHLSMKDLHDSENYFNLKAVSFLGKTASFNPIHDFSISEPQTGFYTLETSTGSSVTVLSQTKLLTNLGFVAVDELIKNQHRVATSAFRERIVYADISKLTQDKKKRKSITPLMAHRLGIVVNGIVVLPSTIQHVV